MSRASSDLFWRRAPIPKRVAIILVFGCMMIVGGCGGCGTGASTVGAGVAGVGGGTSAVANATTTPVATTAAPTATKAPVATKTPPPPTATPVPPLQGKVLVQSLGAVSPNANSSIVDATCPAGYLAAGGGVSSGYTTFNLMWNAPISTATWQAEIFNTSATQTIYAQLQVVCLAVSGLTGQVVIQGLGTIGGNATSSVDVSCPSGYLMAGGGINTGYGSLVTMWSAPISTTTWREEVYNTSGGSAAAQVQAECLKVSGLVGKVVMASLGTVSAGANSTITTACPSGYLVAGGGLNSGYTTETLMQSEPITVTTWRSEIANTGSAIIMGQAQIACLKR